MKTSDNEAWCAWHEHWVQRDICPHCEVVYPSCYAEAHLRFACATYIGVMSQRVPATEENIDVGVPG